MPTRKPRSITDIRSEARKHTATALKTLTSIAAQPKASDTARIAAAVALLDRGWGKAAQPLTGQDGEGPALVEIIRRIEDATAERPHAHHTNGEDLRASSET